MTSLILYPDAIFSGASDIEESIFAETGQLAIRRSAEAVSEELWHAANAIVCYDAAIDASLVERLDSCRIIVRAGVGFDQIDIEACRCAGIPVCNTPDYGTTDVADHTLGLMLALARSILGYERRLARDVVDGWHAADVPSPIRLAGRVLGIVGLGRIGTAVALRAKALGMSVIFHDPYVPSGFELSLGIDRRLNLDALVEMADVITIHTPLTEDTRNLIDGRTLQLTKLGAILINTARGAIVDTQALLECLRSGRVGAAALDVLPTEPPGANDPLLAAWIGSEDLRDRLILTPHIAFRSRESLLDLRRKSAEIARDYLHGGLLRNCVNGPVVDRAVNSSHPSATRPDM